MLTVLGRAIDARSLREVGFAGWVTKPIRCEELRSVLCRAMAGENESAVASRQPTSETLLSARGYRARILVAEDNTVNQQVVLGILKKLGVSADAVATGAEALVAVRTVPYDLVLMEVRMPEMDGITATREIRGGGPISAICLSSR